MVDIETSPALKRSGSKMPALLDCEFFAEGGMEMGRGSWRRGELTTDTSL